MGYEKGGKGRGRIVRVVGGRERMYIDKQMNREFEYKGHWWLPNNPEKKVQGTLKFVPNKGGTLKLEGSFKDIININNPIDFEIILGNSEGKNITLINCWELWSNLNIPGFIKSKYLIDLILVDVHFHNKESIKFKSLYIHFSHLDEWINISGITIHNSPDMKEIDIKYKNPEDILLFDNSNFKIYIVVQAIFSGKIYGPREVKIDQLTFIKIESIDERSLDDYLRIMDYIRYFLTLAISEPVYPLIIEGTTEASKIVLKNENYYQHVKIYFNIPNIPIEFDTIPQFQMFFTYEKVREKCDILLSNWIKKGEQLESIYNLYFGTLYNPRMYLEHQFLSYIQALESYHRRRMNNYEVSEEEHRKRLEEILKSIPTNHRRWLEEKLKYSNELSLRKRLRELIDRYSDILGQFYNDKDMLVNKIIDIRNYLTHYDKELEVKSARGDELFRIIGKLKTLLEVCLLDELGFSHEEIQTIIRRHRPI